MQNEVTFHAFHTHTPKNETTSSSSENKLLDIAANHCLLYSVKGTLFQLHLLSKLDVPLFRKSVLFITPTAHYQKTGMVEKMRPR